MAKMSMQGVTYEGTPEELRAIVATFETAVVTKVEPKISDTVRLVSTGGVPKAKTAGFEIGEAGILSEGIGGMNTFRLTSMNGRKEGFVSAHHIKVVTADVAKLLIPENGDIVRVTNDRLNFGQSFKIGEIGIVKDADGTFQPDVEFSGKSRYADVEVIARAKDRVDAV